MMEEVSSRCPNLSNPIFYTALLPTVVQQSLGQMCNGLLHVSEQEMIL